MTIAYITPNVLEWARNRAHMSLDVLAKKVNNVNPQKVASWESGQAYPTFNQAELIAKALRIPFGYLFLPAPPEIEISIPDRRTLGTGSKPLSNDFVDVLHDCTRKQDWYRAYLIREEAVPLDYLGKFSLRSPIAKVASDIGERIQLEQARQSAKNNREFLNQLVHNAASIGILVLRNGIVGSNTHRPLSVDEFRGFVLHDEYAPLIFINGKDANAAMVFTLIHELAHLWIGASGISNPVFGKAIGTQENKFEAFCNAVAAEALVPANRFRDEWPSDADLDHVLPQMVKAYMVSSLVLLRRAYELELISFVAYKTQYRKEIENQDNNKSDSSGGNWNYTFPNRQNRVLIEAVVRDVLHGGTSYREGASLLGIKPAKINDLVDFDSGL